MEFARASKKVGTTRTNSSIRRRRRCVHQNALTKTLIISDKAFFSFFVSLSRSFTQFKATTLRLVFSIQHKHKKEQGNTNQYLCLIPRSISSLVLEDTQSHCILMATLYVLYGSATGNAEGISKDLTADLNANKATRLPEPFQKAVCLELNQFKKCLKEWSVDPLSLSSPKGQQTKHGVLLVSSTTGNGDAPENASRFTRYIKRQNKDTNKPQPFEHVAYAVLGLGDTNYDQFCATGVLIDRMVHNLGGTRAQPLVCADEGTGLLEETVDPWMATVVEHLAKACTLGSSKPATATATAGDEEEEKEEEKVESSGDNEDTTTTDASTAMVTPPPEISPTPLYILYGSATGTAEAIAKELVATYETILNNPDAKTYFSKVVCAELNQFKKMKLAEDVWSKPPASGNDSVKHGLLVVAETTGNGDPPENAERFLRYLKKSSRAASKDSSSEVRPFQHVAFGVLGLGDSNYDHYCEHAKLLNKYMLELGGTEVRPLTCADEGTGQLEEVVDGWSLNMLLEVTEACRGDSSNATPATTVKQETSVIHQEEEKKVEPFEDGDKSSKPTSPGVLLVQSLLGDDASVAKVEASVLPRSALASHVTSVEFVSDDFQGVEIDAAYDDDQSEDDEIQYTMEDPYSSCITNARYLTKTSLDAADEIAEAMGSETSVSARDVLNRRFPLQIENDVQEASRNGKRVIELTLTLPNDNSWAYQPGDSLGLIASNTPQAVEFVLNMLQSNHGISPTQKVSIDSGAPLTVEEVVRDKIDLCTFVKSRKVLFALSQVCNNRDEISALELLSSKTERGIELFETYITAQRRSIVDLLKEFPSCQTITLQNLVSILPPIPPRYYSIASSPLGRQGNAVHIAFSVVDYLTPSLTLDGKEVGLRRIRGVATSHLEALCAPLMSNPRKTEFLESFGVKIFPKPSEEFHLPSDLSIPLILVGPGTGIAPFLGFLEHRNALMASAGAEATIGSTEVFFGCRHANHDDLYPLELEGFRKEGVIDQVHKAFSRDGPKKEYVQDLMLCDKGTSERLAETILNKKGRVYICGDGNHMGRDVQAAIADLLGPHLNSIEETTASPEVVGKQYVESMKREGRFLLDIWS